MAKTNPIPADSQDSEDRESARLLNREATRANRSAPAKSSASNGSAVGGKAVAGGARVRGGRA